MSTIGVVIVFVLQHDIILVVAPLYIEDLCWCLCVILSVVVVVGNVPFFSSFFFLSFLFFFVAIAPLGLGPPRRAVVLRFLNTLILPHALDDAVLCRYMR